MTTSTGIGTRPGPSGDGPGPAARPMETVEAVRAQVEEARDRLRAAAVDAGVDPDAVDAAVDAAVADLAGAHVHAFIGLLVERSVRDALGLRAGSDPN